MRAVIDTNVLVSALLLRSSKSRQCLDRILQQGTLLLSSRTIAELDEVLRRPRFSRYVTDEERVLFLATLLDVSMLLEPS